MSVTGCRHQPPTNGAQKPDSPWPGFGEPGVGKISVVVHGDVRHPGHYYLPAGASLESIYATLGGWGGRGEFHAPPTKVRLTREVGGQRTEMDYYIKKMTANEKAAVKLQDGDILYYPIILF